MKKTDDRLKQRRVVGGPEDAGAGAVQDRVVHLRPLVQPRRVVLHRRRRIGVLRRRLGGVTMVCAEAGAMAAAHGVGIVQALRYFPVDG